MMFRDASHVAPSVVSPSAGESPVRNLPGKNPEHEIGPGARRRALRARASPAGVRELVASVLRRCRPPLGETTVEIVGASRIGHARHDRVANFLTQVGYPKQAALVARLGHLASGVVVVCEDGAIVVATVAAKPLGDA